MSLVDQVAKGVAAFLTQLWGSETRVESPRVASAGARRLNLLFDAVRDGASRGLVATVVANPAMQIMDVEVEADNLRLAESVGMPAPHVVAVCKDPSVAGGPFFLTERVDGETIPRRVLRLVEATEGLGARLGRQCGEALGRLHGADLALARDELARPVDQEAAQQALDGVEALVEALLQPSPAFQLALGWLDRNRPPAPPRLGIVHGDFRNGNLIVGDDGLRAALDWEICRIGDPMEDLAWLCQRMWRFRNDSLEVGGFASRSELRAGYESAGGHWDDAGFHWWKVMGTLRWGLGLAGQAAAHLDGSVPSIVMAGSGRRVAELEYDALMLLRRSYE